MGGARRPESRGCRPMVRCCMVGRSILNSMTDSRGMTNRRTIYCKACKLSRYVLQVCLRRLVFVCTGTSVLRSLDSGRIVAACKAFQVGREAVRISQPLSFLIHVVTAEQPEVAWPRYAMIRYAMVAPRVEKQETSIPTTQELYELLR